VARGDRCRHLPVMLEILRANVAVIGLVNVQVVQAGFRSYFDLKNSLG